MARTRSNNPSDWIQTAKPEGYMNNRDILLIGEKEHFLVKGSKNTLISNKEKVVAAKGFTLKGSAKTNNSKVYGSYDWETSTGQVRSLRANQNSLEVWYRDAWRSMPGTYVNDQFSFAPRWDTTELIDRLTFVQESDTVYDWAGGITRVASVSSNTITKEKYVSGTTFSFTNNAGSNDTINDSSNGFVTALFEAGDYITVSGSTDNDGTYRIESVSAGVLTLYDDETLTTESAGDTVTISDKSVGSWSQARYLTSGTRKVWIGGNEYTYTGGESTGTLTGVTPDPSADGVTNGDIAIQQIIEATPAKLDGMSLDRVAVLNNHVFYGSTISRVWYASSSTDYTDFTQAGAVRAPGEYFEGVLDGTLTAFVPTDTKMRMSAKRGFWYELTMTLTSDGSGEVITQDRIPSAQSQAARNQDCIVPITNGETIFVSFEPTIDTIERIGNIDSTRSVPISDMIKTDLDGYDLTGVNGLYNGRNLYILIPEESLLLIYDAQYGYWQPPYEISGQRLALIDNQVCVHSSTGNETYKLFDGYNANGSPIERVAAFGYSNYGSRFAFKNFTEIVAEIKMRTATVITDTIRYNYLGTAGEEAFEYKGTDRPNVPESTASQGGFGKEPFGANPLGSVDEADDPIKLGRWWKTTKAQDFFELQRVFKSSGDSDNWEILAFGADVMLSDNQPIQYRD